MKKQFKTKLVLNSQTVRRLREEGLQAAKGGIPVDNTNDVCISYPCGRGCG